MGFLWAREVVNQRLDDLVPSELLLRIQLSIYTISYLSSDQRDNHSSKRVNFAAAT